MSIAAPLRHTTAMAAVGLILAGATPALAQAADEDEGLGEIIVTAQRREENQQKVPISVATVSGATLDAIAARAPIFARCPAGFPASTSKARSGALSRGSISAVWATPISISTPRSRSVWFTTTWCWKTRS